MDEEDSSNDGGVYVYNGVDEVPRDVTHVRVESSVTVIPQGAFRQCYYLEEVEVVVVVDMDYYCLVPAAASDSAV